MVGDPELCVNKIGRLKEIYGITDVSGWTRLGELDRRKVMRSMELCAKYLTLTLPQ